MTKEEKKALTEAIELQRFKKKKTQQDCANLFGVSVVTYREYEKNPDKLSISQALMLSKYLEWDFFKFFLTDILQNAIYNK